MRAETKRRLVWGTIGLAVILGLAFAFYPRAMLIDLATVERGPMMSTVAEEGFTRVHDVFTLSAPVTGRVRRIEVHAGDSVAAQQTVLAELEPVDPSFLDPRSEAQAKAGLRVAEAAHQRAISDLERVGAELEFARAEYQRAVELIRDGTIAQRDFDNAERAYKATGAAVDTAREALHVAQFEVDRARAQLLSPATSQRRSGECACVPITAPISGQVLQIFDPSERVVTMGEPLLQIGDPSRLEIVVDLLSTDAVKVEAGQRVLIERWGGEHALEGRVQRVEPFGFTKVSALGIEEQRVNVLIDFTTPRSQWQRLGHGYQVETRIILWQSDDALMVPLTALFRDGQEWAVFVEDGGRARFQTIRLGRRNSLVAQVVQGLEGGEKLVVHPTDRVAAGTRIADRR